MRFILAVLAVTSVCLSPTFAASRDNVVTKTKNLITTFLTAVQAGTVWDSIRNDMYALKTTPQITSTLRTKIQGTLGGDQAMKAMTIYNNLVSALGGQAKYDTFAGKCLVVLNNNLGPLADQVRAKVKSMKSAGKTQAAIYNQVYYMFDLYLTKDRISAILTRTKGKVLPSEWTAFRKSTSSVINFATYGL